MEDKDPRKDPNENESSENAQEIEDKDLDKARGGVISRVTIDPTQQYR